MSRSGSAALLKSLRSLAIISEQLQQGSRGKLKRKLKKIQLRYLLNGRESGSDVEKAFKLWWATSCFIKLISPAYLSNQSSPCQQSWRFLMKPLCPVSVQQDWQAPQALTKWAGNNQSTIRPSWWHPGPVRGGTRYSVWLSRGESAGSQVGGIDSGPRHSLAVNREQTSGSHMSSLPSYYREIVSARETLNEPWRYDKRSESQRRGHRL